MPPVGAGVREGEREEREATKGGRWGCGIITNINCVSNELLEPELLSADVNLLSSPALQWVRSRFLRAALSPFLPFSVRVVLPRPPPRLPLSRIAKLTMLLARE